MGEGLCSRGGDIGPIIVQVAVLGSDGDIFVGGNFATRVWDGHHFVYVFHVARFDGTQRLFHTINFPMINHVKILMV